jgi:hypothetical protein
MERLVVADNDTVELSAGLLAEIGEGVPGIEDRPRYVDREVNRRWQVTWN